MKVKTQDNIILDVQCQQYEIGLYVCFYKDGRLYDQFGLDITKEQFLKDLNDGKLGLTVL